MCMRTLMRAGFLVASLALVAAGCGGGSSNKTTGASGTASGEPVSGAQKGGSLTVLSLADVDSLDPGYWYYQYDYMALAQPTQRWLYSWKADATHATPDIASGLPQVSDGGKTLTIKLRPGIKYSAPLQTRTVAAADVKYALERCFLPQVGNGYANLYYSEIVGVDEFKSGKAKEISGIT